MDFKDKYLKYKEKYLKLKNQIGGGYISITNTCNEIKISDSKTALKMHDIVRGIAPRNFTDRDKLVQLLDILYHYKTNMVELNEDDFYIINIIFKEMHKQNLTEDERKDYEKLIADKASFLEKFFLFPV
jgi:hypothetical protein